MRLFTQTTRLLSGLLLADFFLIQTANAEESRHLDTVVVTATREEKLQSEVADSITVIDSEAIEFVSPSHPAEVLNRTAGVHVNNLGGEGHMTAIRQPISTGGVYLFLEDGIPVRPTGLFNHNALYEINVPQSDRMEIIKGPGSALYGSDSIGGIINSISKPSPDELALEVNPEFGSYGWQRVLVSGGSPINNNTGFRLNINLTDNEGYRDESDYSRSASTGRIDGTIGDYTRFKTILSYSHVDQSGISSLEESDYRNDPKKNRYHNDVGRREVDALRLSTEFSYEADDNNLFTFTPFFRDNQMKLMPSWMLSYDPNDRDYQFKSYGMLTKYRRKIPAIKTEFITGLDIDYTPSRYREIRLNSVREGDIFTDTTATGRTNYHFEADQLSVSPYLHGEWQGSEKLRLTGGFRYDYFRVDYTDKLPSSVAETQRGFRHLRPESQELSYDHFSPKFGPIYDVGLAHNVYANYRHSFRVPSIGQLFRSGSTSNTADLDPVQTDSVEIGFRGQWFSRFNYNATLYHMIVKDDIVTYIDNSSGDRKVTNAGKTEHQGFELEVGGKLTKEWRFRTAWSYSNQEYKNYTAVFGFPSTQINYEGNKVGKAPKTLGNLAFQYRPAIIPGAQFELEWEHLGDYYTDETNTQKYDGHNLLNFRASHIFNDNIELYGRVSNLTDKRYSNYTSNQVGNPDIQYRPGLARAFYIGLRAKL